MSALGTTKIGEGPFLNGEITIYNYLIRVEVNK